MKRLSNKYGKNSKNNKFNKILHLEREKIKNGFVKSVYKFRKNRKSNNWRLFLAMWKDWVINIAKKSKNSKFYKIQRLQKETVKERKKVTNVARIANLATE